MLPGVEKHTQENEMHPQSTMVSILLGFTSAGIALVVGCTDATVEVSPPNPPEISITGDDAKQIRAKGYEEALEKAKKREEEAEAAGDTAFAQDWKDIQANIKKAKENQAATDWEALAEETGKLEVIENPDGTVTYHWTSGG